ncbi:phosphotransferase [Actinomadura xylanilytica]|uniref:phosphotransferase n=1 Tax=Actinomadura xylanilytica TaxID=887459 RepID=UPI00255B01E0|nr:phosphotransferase [Actinomadura xylanilytica]MDL4774452.1 phosphotransferase [Actinomadura xylanilytica]
MRSTWTDLPTEVRDAVQAHTGEVTGIDPAPAGNHAEIAVTLHTTTARTFIKAARKLGDQDGAEVWSLRNEAAINPHVTVFAPRLLWQAEAGGWLALGFEHVDGRHADFTPGSPDLEILAKTLQSLQTTPCPDEVRMRVERRWAPVAEDVTPMAGNALLHTDLNSDNLLITPDGQARVVDWAFAARGAAWVELGVLTPWLLKAGHTPAGAADWISQFTSWTAADPAHIDLFSQAFAARWAQHAARLAPEAWVTLHADLTRRWAEHRTGRPS